MKALLSRNVLVVLAILTISIGLMSALATWPELVPPGWQTRAYAEEVSLPGALPPRAIIKLKGGASVSGRIIACDSQKLDIQRGSDTELIPRNQVEKIQFDVSDPVYQTDGRIFVRDLTPGPLIPYNYLYTEVPQVLSRKLGGTICASGQLAEYLGE